MEELERIKKVAQPDNILLVVDAMTGQAATDVAKGFDQRLDITGIVLTKLDGDTRGGAALSIRLLPVSRLFIPVRVKSYLTWKTSTQTGWLQEFLAWVIC